MIFVQVIILAVLQGACELLPVSSSAHVIIAEKLMGIDPTTPDMTLLLVMLHTGTMLAVIIYFWPSWKASYFQSGKTFWDFIRLVSVATLLTGVVGLVLKVLIEEVFLSHVANAEVEMIFGNLGLISLSLAAAGIFIIVSGWKEMVSAGEVKVGLRGAVWIGAVQGLCLPFRGFSRSGATISTGLLARIRKRAVEEFSFALVVVLTPPIILKEVYRLFKAHHLSSIQTPDLFHLLLPSIVGMVASFLAGLLALKWLSSWLERGRWKYFGYYCLAASALAFFLYRSGF